MALLRVPSISGLLLMISGHAGDLFEFCSTSADFGILRLPPMNTVLIFWTFFFSNKGVLGWFVYMFSCLCVHTRKIEVGTI